MATYLAKTDPFAVDPSRPAVVYGIREVSSGKTRYVGSTVNYRGRKYQGYGQRVAEWANANEHEFYVLEETTVAHQAERERFHMARLRAEGHELLNMHSPQRTRAMPPDAAHLAWLERSRNSLSGVAIRETWQGQANRWKDAAKKKGENFYVWARAALDRAAAEVDLGPIGDK